LRSAATTSKQAEIALQCDRFRLRFALLALRLNHATPVTLANLELVREVSAYARATMRDANAVLTAIAEYRGRTVERTRAFLTRTMIPSVQVVLAGSLLEIARAAIPFAQDPATLGENGRWMEEKTEIESIIRSLTTDPNGVTFRVDYNLACFWSRVKASGLPIDASLDVIRDSADSKTSSDPSASTAPLDKSYAHLRRALANAPYGEGVRLARLAGNDPALASLAHDEQWADLFKLLLDGYRETDAPPDDPTGPDET
jgi:hypothetical protein